MGGFKIKFTPHEGQRAVIESRARFRVVACGRRWGKTLVSSMLTVEEATQKPERLCWWVAPVYDQAKIAFRIFLKNLPPNIMEVNRTEKSIYFPHNGSRVEFKSADRPETLRGEGVDWLVVDEAAFVKEDAWNGALRPTLSDTHGYALLIGTFDGDENWFYEGYERGQDPEHEAWESWRFRTADNPYIPASEIEEARRTLPQAVFEQEYESSPLSYAGAVFAGAQVQAAWERGAGLEFIPFTFTTEAGLDWGYTNPTALEVAQITPDDYVRWVDETLWHSVELNERCAEIALKCKRLGISRIYADAAGKDENVTLAKHLKNLGVKTTIKPVPFNKFKTTGITARRWHLERGREAISHNCRVLFRDTKRYRYKEDAAKEDVIKEDDHTVDATIALYATRFPKAAGRTD